MIEVSRSALISALEPCARVANQRSTMPILAHVLLEAAAGRLAYRATNLQHEVSGWLACSADREGYAINARELLGAVQSLEGDAVLLTPTKDTRVTVKGAGKRSFKLPALPSVEFPTAMSIGGGQYSLPAGVLPALLGGVAFAARTDNDRPEQCVVNLSRKDGKLRAMATNGGRVLAWQLVDCPAELSLSIPIDVVRYLVELDGDVEVTTDGHVMSFVHAGQRLSCSAPAGDFPPMDLAIDSYGAPTCSTRVDSAKLLDAVKAVRRAGDDVSFAFGNGAILLEARGQGAATDELDADVSGEHSATLPSDQVTAALGRVEGEIELRCGPGDLDPVRFIQGDWCTYVMPLKPEFVASKRAA